MATPKSTRLIGNNTIPFCPAFWCSTNIRSALLSGYNGACTINRERNPNMPCNESMRLIFVTKNLMIYILPYFCMHQYPDIPVHAPLTGIMSQIELERTRQARDKEKERERERQRERVLEILHLDAETEP